VYACEVVTHLHGTLYSGIPNEGWWNEYGNEGYQYTLNRLWEKFEEDLHLLEDVFDDADDYRFQFWSPVVPQGTLPEAFEEMKDRFQDKHGEDIEVLIMKITQPRLENLRGKPLVLRRVMTSLHSVSSRFFSTSERNDLGYYPLCLLIRPLSPSRIR
jgi:hypothetical protein